MNLVVGAAKPDRGILRKPDASDPASPQVLTRHLINSHLQPDVLERYGLPFYDLQLAYLREIELPEFKKKLMDTVTSSNAALSTMLSNYGFPLTVTTYREQMFRTLLYGEFLEVLPQSRPEELDSLRQLCGPIRPVVVPFSSRDELFDPHFASSLD